MISLDWTSPIEAVHEDGRVVAIELSGGPDFDGHYRLVEPLEPFGQALYFCGNGTQAYELSFDKGKPWRIRNVAKTEEPVKAESPSPELVARMVALVRDMGAYKGGVLAGLGSLIEDAFAEARAIVAELPAEVDADLVEARKLAAEVEDHPYGSLEDLARAAIRRGRELEKGVG